MNYAISDNGSLLDAPHAGASEESKVVENGLAEVLRHCAASVTRRMSVDRASGSSLDVFAKAWMEATDILRDAGRDPSKLLHEAGASLRAWEGRELPIDKDEV